MTQKISIIGDGIIGKMVAVALHDLNFDVTVFHNEQSKKTNERYFSINLLSRHLFEDCNIWPAIKTKGTNPYCKIITWDNLQPEEVLFESCNIGESDLAYVISESNILNAINSKIQKKSIKFESINNLNDNLNKYDYAINTINNNHSSTCSETRYKTNYEQKAIVMNIDVDNSSNVAYQKFLDGQILGLIPISNKSYNLIWSVDDKKTDNILKKTKNEMIHFLNSELEEKIGKIRDCSSYDIFPLFGYLGKDCFNEKIIYIGSALHSVHPLAGLGLNMGLQDIYCLTSKIKKNSKHIDTLLLYEFQDFIRSVNKRTYYGINFLKKFYCDFTSPNLRKYLLSIFNSNATLRKSVIRFATGLQTKDKISKQLRRLQLQE